MSASRHLAALAVAATVLIPTASPALEDHLRALSNGPTELRLCGKDASLASSDACKQNDNLTSGIEKVLQATLARTPANIRPLLKRDQVWFNEMMLSAADAISNFTDDETADTREAVLDGLLQRIQKLHFIAGGFGRPGVAGAWTNVFGSVDVTPADGGYRLTFDTRAAYGIGGRFLHTCKISALVKPGSGAWLTGAMLADARPANADTGTTEAKAAPSKSEPAKPTTIKIRRQGETLRIVLGNEEWNEDEHPGCEDLTQLTGSYFAVGKPDAATDKSNTAFVVPTFDCARPESASEEEICADPDLAENDQKLNRAWKALLPQLDETTRRMLAEDQRNWVVKSQALQYPEFLHPGWEKQTSQIHHTNYGRDRLLRLQLERIALIDGFDEQRQGIAGTWLAYNAVLEVTVTNGKVTAKGWKWNQGDWKAGCDYEMTGSLVDGAFRSSDGAKNADTLERDHASLVVNRLDDVFASKRGKKDGAQDAAGNEQKCRRYLKASSTARLFPARPSPDIDNLGDGIIR
jgi:hypothetical protein